MIKSRPAGCKAWQQALIPILTGTVYWGLVARLSSANEPWDATLYWPVLYPGSIALAGALGAKTTWRPDLIGLGLTLPQVLIIFITKGATPMIFVGLMFAAVLSLPAIFSAWLAAKGFRSR